MTTRDVVVGAGDAGRLEAAARAALPAASRRTVQRLIADGLVRLNGRRAAKGTTVQPGDVLTVPADLTLEPQPDLPVRLLASDPCLVVVDKPGGLRAHALDPRDRNTVAAWLRAHFPETAACGDPLGGGLVHRLDTGTSGVLVAARSPEVFRAMRRAFRARAVAKRYRAVVAGRLEGACRIDAPLAHDPSDRRRMRPARGDERAWAAITEVVAVDLGDERTVVDIVIPTGVTHQIRAHLAAAGHPVLGDPLYGGPPHPALAPGRHALHAASIGFAHPADGTAVVHRAPWPADLRALYADD